VQSKENIEILCKYVSKDRSLQFSVRSRGPVLFGPCNWGIRSLVRSRVGQEDRRTGPVDRIRATIFFPPDAGGTVMPLGTSRPYRFAAQLRAKMRKVLTFGLVGWLVCYFCFDVSVLTTHFVSFKCFFQHWIASFKYQARAARPCILGRSVRALKTKVGRPDRAKPLPLLQVYAGEG